LKAFECVISTGSRRSKGPHGCPGNPSRDRRGRRRIRPWVASSAGKLWQPARVCDDVIPPQTDSRPATTIWCCQAAAHLKIGAATLYRKLAAYGVTW